MQGSRNIVSKAFTKLKSLKIFEFFLENLKSVDFVEIFDEETPLDLIKQVRPDVLVKGGDWDIDQIVGSNIVLSYGGKVESLHFLDGHSTTKIIQDLQGRE